MFVADLKTWYDARTHCQSLGGQMFSDLDGTAEQLRLLVDTFGYQTMWLGVYRSDLNSTEWTTAEDKPMPNELMYWDVGHGEPSFGVDQFVALAAADGMLFYLHDRCCSTQNTFLCLVK